MLNVSSTVWIGGMLYLLVAANGTVPNAQKAASKAPSQRSITSDAIAARELLGAAASKYGGAAVDEIERLHVTMQGDVFNGLQGYEPSSVESASLTGTTLLEADFDFAGHRFRRRVLQILPGDIHLDSVAYFHDGQLTTDYPGGKHTLTVRSAESAVADSLLRLVPALLMRRATRNLATATAAGEYVASGRRIQLVDFSVDGSSRVRAHIRVDDHAVVAVEAPAVDPLVGDDLAVYTFDGDRVVNSVHFPERVTVTRRGHPYIAFTLRNAQINQTMDSGLFVAPAHSPLQIELATAPIGGGAYEIRGLDGGAFRVIFFDLGDGVAVFDAPESRQRSEWVAAEIARTVGNKPIKYLVLSHFHDDHAVGVGYYVDRGVKIVTVRDNEAIVRRFATTASKLRPDLPSLGRAPTFLLVDAQHLRVSGSAGEIEIFKLADCPHAKDMLVAYLPHEKLLIEADLFVELAGPSNASRALLKWLQQPGAPAVEWVAGPHLRRTALSVLSKEVGASPGI